MVIVPSMTLKNANTDSLSSTSPGQRTQRFRGTILSNISSPKIFWLTCFNIRSASTDDELIICFLWAESGLRRAWNNLTMAVQCFQHQTPYHWSLHGSGLTLEEWC